MIVFGVLSWSSCHSVCVSTFQLIFLFFSLSFFLLLFICFNVLSITVKHGKGDMKMDHKMWMWFHTVVNDTVLFDFWKIQSTGGI